MRLPLIATTLAFLLLFAAYAGAQEPTPRAAPVGAVSSADTTPAPRPPADLEVTVYAAGQAVVRERREVALDLGLNDVTLDGLPRGLRPETVLLKPQCPNGFTVEQTAFDADILTPRRLLEANIGKTVRLVRTDANGRTMERTATVISPDGPILDIDGRVQVGTDWRLAFDAVPPGMSATPALTAKLSSAAQGSCAAEIVYLTTGLGWQADYTLIMTGGEQGRLVASATVDNRSGRSFEGAALKVVAGRVNLGGGRPMPMARAEMAMAAPADAPRQAMETVHLFDLGGDVDLADRSQARLPLFSSTLPTTLSRVFESAALVHQGAGTAAPANPAVRVSLATDGDGGPLPAGALRAYQAMPDGTLRLLGEDRVADTAAGQPLELALGADADVTVKRFQSSYFQRGKNAATASEEITVSNAKDRPVSVTLRLRFPGQWTITDSPAPYTKPDARTAQWVVPIQAGATSTLRYTVEVQF